MILNWVVQIHLTTSNPEEVDADEWFDCLEAEDHVLVEGSVGDSNSGVLSLLWWQDEAMLIE